MISPFSPQILYSLTQLRQYLLAAEDIEMQDAIRLSEQHNAWFTRTEIRRAISNIAAMLDADVLKSWKEKEINGGSEATDHTLKSVGMVLAGNLPLVGFHDILCTLVSGNKALIKLSSQDKFLTPLLLKKWAEFYPTLVDQFAIVDRLENYDGIIATGSNNTARYFEAYFGKVPNIIRKNRNSVAVLDGTESQEELRALGHDIFDYYGLGCRNVAKLYVPVAYDFIPFFEAIESFNTSINHHKYANNYDYNKAIFLVNKNKHFDNGFLLVKRDEDNMLSSPLATVFYEEYTDLSTLSDKLAPLSEKIQVIVGHSGLSLSNEHVSFGEGQQPMPWNYADGVNTIAFLLSL